jgi:hypothetical protein
MNLVERYIEAVKFWLPKQLRDDVAAELADDIRSEIEESEREKGRKLTDDEVAAILKARGRPMLVASRYLPKRWLIGPELYPIYIFVLKIVALVSLVPAVATVLIGVASHQDLGQSYGQAWDQFWTGLWSAFAAVTIIFAIIERQGMKPSVLDKWNPKALRPVVDSNRIPRSTSVGDIIGGLVLIALFAAGYLSHNVYTFPGVQLTLAPQWVPFCQMSIVIAAVEVAVSAANLFTPYWTVSSILARVGIDIAKTAVFFWLITANLLRDVRALGMPQPVHDALLNVSVTVMQNAQGVAGLVVLVILAHAGWRLFHLKPARTAVA